MTSDTATAGQGTLEFELGSVDSSGGMLELPLAAHLGVGAASEVFAEANFYQRVPNDTGGHAEGFGDLGIGLRYRPIDEGDRVPSVAFELGLGLPTADAERGLGAGHPSAALSVLAAKSLPGALVLARGQIGASGQDAGDFDAEYVAAGSVAFPLHDAVSLFLELAGSFVPEQHLEDVGTTVGVAWAASDSVLLELGWGKGLTSDATDTVLLFGATWNVGPVL